MTRDELVRHLVMLPPDAEVVVDILEIVGLTFPGERSNIALKPHPDDLRDEAADHASVPWADGSGAGTFGVEASTGRVARWQTSTSGHEFVCGAAGVDCRRRHSPGWPG